MTLDQWIGSLSADEHRELEVLCSACGVFAKGCHTATFGPCRPSGGGEPWIDRIPPLVALVCTECFTALIELQKTETLTPATLIRFSRRAAPRAADEWLAHSAEILDERARRRHLKVV